MDRIADLALINRCSRIAHQLLPIWYRCRITGRWETAYSPRCGRTVLLVREWEYAAREIEACRDLFSPYRRLAAKTYGLGIPHGAFTWCQRCMQSRRTAQDLEFLWNT